MYGISPCRIYEPELGIFLQRDPLIAWSRLWIQNGRRIDSIFADTILSVDILKQLILKALSKILPSYAAGNPIMTSDAFGLLTTAECEVCIAKKETNPRVKELLKRLEDNKCKYDIICCGTDDKNYTAANRADKHKTGTITLGTKSKTECEEMVLNNSLVHELIHAVQFCEGGTRKDCFDCLCQELNAYYQEGQGPVVRKKWAETEALINDLAARAKAAGKALDVSTFLAEIEKGRSEAKKIQISGAIASCEKVCTDEKVKLEDQEKYLNDNYDKCKDKWYKDK